MPREPRLWLPEVTYHCYSRCLEMRNYFESLWVQEMAAAVINQALEKYDFQLVQMNFVSDHFHIMIRTVEGGENISRIMQYIKSRIAENYNRKVGRTGPFWHGRFQCKIIEHARNPASYLLNASLYIAYNRVVKGLDKDVKDSKYNTFRMLLEEDYRPPVKITLHPYFHALGRTQEELIPLFKKYDKAYRKRLFNRRRSSLSPPL